jgi:hypothetical protein
MAVTPVWYTDDQYTICVIHDGTWTWNDFQQALTELDIMLGSVAHTVNFIVDLRTSDGLPTGLPAQLGKINEFYSHPNAGCNVIVGANTITKVFVNIITSVFPHLKRRIQLASTLELAADNLLQLRQQNSRTAESTKK